MMRELLFILYSLFAVTCANKYTKAKCTKDENGQEFCEKQEEEEEDEEPCFYEDPKESLFQWDPVEVNFFAEISNKYMWPGYSQLKWISIVINHILHYLSK